MNPGIHTISSEQYHADPTDRPSLSASMASLLLSGSPAHARAAHPKLNPDFERVEETRFDVGNVVHALALQGIEIAEVLPFSDWRTKDAKEARETARQYGRIPLLQGQWSEVQQMYAALRPQLDAMDAEPPLFTDGLPEQTLIWHEGDVTCRSRFDWLRDDRRAIDDLKTTSRSANPEGWTRNTMFNIGADVQAAFYLRGARAVLDAEPVFRWVVQETYAPYALSVVSPGPDVLALAEAKVLRAIELWRRCLDSGEWPAYPQRVCYAELPPWLETQWLESQAREEIAA